ncbi:ComF family protein [Candidatus Peregrinibacteria bacterium]|nr:ComF family protein [Candidatus Peregrinibacteria bacterium]
MLSNRNGSFYNIMSIFSLVSIFHRLRGNILDFLFPRRCVGCGTIGSHLCHACLTAIPLLSKQSCPLCRRESSGGEICQPFCGEPLIPRSFVNKNHWQQRYVRGNSGLFFVSLAIERDLLHQRVQRIIEEKIPVFLKSREPPPLDALIVGTEYKSGHVLPKAIHRLKYTFDIELAGELAHILINQFHRHFTGNYYFEEWVVTAIPLHQSRERWRGFNQAESLAIHFCQTISLPYARLLVREKNTPAQAKLSRNERLRNVFSAFSLAPDADIVGKNILLIDDVCTTGSTLIQCAEILKRHGAKNVTGLVLGRGF